MCEAIIFYGLRVIPDSRLNWEFDTWEDFYAAQMGLSPSSSTSKEMTTYVASKRKLIDECCASVFWSDPGEELLIAHKDSVHRTGSKWIVPAGPPITVGWFEHLQRFCKVMGIRGKEPCWWLAII